MPQGRQAVCLVHKVRIINYHSVKYHCSPVHCMLSQRKAATYHYLSLAQLILNPLMRSWVWFCPLLGLFNTVLLV